MLFRSLHVAQADRAAINPPPPPNVLGPANAAPNNPPPPPGPAPLGPAPAAPNNALGPAPAAQPLIRPWFPWIPERGPERVNNAVINLQRSLIAYFVVYERLYTDHNSVLCTPQRLLYGLVEAVNNFAALVLRYSNAFEQRRNLLRRIHQIGRAHV